MVDRFGARFGGAEAYGVELARELHAAGHELTVIARAYDEQCDLRLPFEPISTPCRCPSWLRVWLFARRAARQCEGRFDIVHSHMNGWCGDVEVVHVTPVRYRWRVQAMGWWRRASSRLSPRVQTYLRLEQRRVRARPGHAVVAVSGLIAEQLGAAYGSERVYPVIAPGVATGRPLPEDEKSAARARLGLPVAAKICLLVARNPMRKGLPTVLNALAQLPEEVCLLVVGTNEAAREYVAKVDDSLRARVHLVAATAHVAQYYQVADICVHPTLNDSFGMAPLEAMSFGLPVIMSPAPWCGFAQYVQPGEQALLLANPEDYSGLAAAVRALLAEAQLYARLRANALALARSYSWGAVAQQYLRLYAQIMRERV